MAVPEPTSAPKGFLKRFRSLLEDLEHCDEVDLLDALRLEDSKVRIPRPVVPVQLRLDGLGGGEEDSYRLHLYPELVARAGGRMRPTGDSLLFEPTRYFSEISGFLRLSPGDSLTLGRDDRLQRVLLEYPKLVADRHLQLKLTDKGLALRNRSAGQGVCVAPLSSRAQIERIIHWRQGKLARLAEILDGPIAAPTKDAALDLLQRVIALLGQEPYREPDSRGAPGGLLLLPDRPIPIFVGDLHANIDNLLVILTQNGFLEGLETGEAMLILLGDAVHPDSRGKEDQMDSSMLMMDLIFQLKLRFPDRVFYLRGNHDSFAEDLSKGGVPQGLLWERALHDRRGPRYRRAMGEFYAALPHLALSRRYVACHAGPPTGKVTRAQLVDLAAYPKLQHQLTHGRLRRPHSPTGYHRGDVHRLRRRLGLEPDAPLVVGHTPLSMDATCWPHAGGIRHHHVLFGAHPQWAGVITRVGKQLVPLRYPSEPLLRVFNQYLRTAEGLRL